jgi:hypothetical protein
MDLREIGWGCGVDSSDSGVGPVAGCCECGDEPSGSGATELVSQPKLVRMRSRWLVCRLNTLMLIILLQHSDDVLLGYVAVLTGCRSQHLGEVCRLLPETVSI